MISKVLRGGRIGGQAKRKLVESTKGKLRIFGSNPLLNPAHFFLPCGPGIKWLRQEKGLRVSA